MQHIELTSAIKSGPTPRKPSDQPAGKALATMTLSRTGLPGSVRTATKAVSILANP